MQISHKFKIVCKTFSNRDSSYYNFKKFMHAYRVSQNSVHKLKEKLKYTSINMNGLKRIHNQEA